ncbi:hypothetical protein [Methylomonas sp. AM2-LC]|uniref:hypothetical protein n=1 Tax=Methylomonas sp. AM2-LC TaxID=3153301 RepID=UPI0032635E4C
MAESRVVIKINYDKDQQSASAPKIVTVWHYGRISVALAILVVPVVIMLLFWPERTVVKQGINPAQTAQIDSLPRDETKGVGVNPGNGSIDTKIEGLQQKGLQQNNKKIEPNNRKLRSISAIILDKKVIRASLNTSIKDNEPYQQVKESIILAKQDSIQLF